jgi:hypothetical protein
LQTRLPPIEQGREFDSLDSAGNSEAEKQPVEMSFHGSACHFELAGNFGVVTALQEQFDDLLFAGPQANGRIPHVASLLAFSGNSTADTLGNLQVW